MTDNRSHTDIHTNYADSYRIFLLTCWQEEDGGLCDPESWRFRLEDPRTGGRRGCVGTKRLVALLIEQLADSLMSESISIAVQENNQTDST